MNTCMRVLLVAALPVFLVIGLACSRRPERPALRPVVLPDVSAAAAPVQEKIRAQYAVVQQKTSDRTVAAAELAVPYGELGELLLAAEYLDAAAIALDDARVLAPGDRRWPYYLAHVYRYKHDTAKAAEWFRAALAVKKDDEPALVWLGEMELAQGHVDAAREAFERALAIDGDSAAAHYGVGRVALERGEYPTAIEHLEAAARLAPQASRVHYPLGRAYQGAGNAARAEAEFRLRGDADVAPADPLMSQLGALLDSAPAHERRGAAALEEQQWGTAVGELQRAIALAPDRADTRVNLATALYMTGDVDGAIEQLQRAVHLSPSLASAHYSLGVILASRDRDADAITELTTAVQANESLVPAHLELANALQRAGRPSESLPHYREVLDRRPAESSARFGYAMALVRLGRYADARDWLEEATRAFPDQPGFLHALARILAAAPDASVRDGARALAITRQLLSQSRSLAVGETMAMALAEERQFDDAARLQRQVLDAADKAGQKDVARRLRANLARYERREPCRVPWADDDPVFHPRPAPDDAVRAVGTPLRGRDAASTGRGP